MNLQLFTHNKVHFILSSAYKQEGKTRNFRVFNFIRKAKATSHISANFIL